MQTVRCPRGRPSRGHTRSGGGADHGCRAVSQALRMPTISMARRSTAATARCWCCTTCGSSTRSRRSSSRSTLSFSRGGGHAGRLSRRRGRRACGAEHSFAMDDASRRSPVGQPVDWSVRQLVDWCAGCLPVHKCTKSTILITTSTQDFDEIVHFSAAAPSATCTAHLATRADVLDAQVIRPKASACSATGADDHRRDRQRQLRVQQQPIHPQPVRRGAAAGEGFQTSVLPPGRSGAAAEGLAVVTSRTASTTVQKLMQTIKQNLAAISSSTTPAQRCWDQEEAHGAVDDIIGTSPAVADEVERIVRSSDTWVWRRASATRSRVEYRRKRSSIQQSTLALWRVSPDGGSCANRTPIAELADLVRRTSQ